MTTIDNAATVRLPRVKAAAQSVRPWWLAAGTALDRFDAFCLVALGGLLLGGTVWFGFGPALFLVSALLLVFAVAAASKAEQAAAREAELAAADAAQYHRRPPRLED